VTTRLVQLLDPQGQRRLASVEGDQLRLLAHAASAYEAAEAAIRRTIPLSEVITTDPGSERLTYEEVHALRTAWRILPAFDHPSEPARCLVSGTGLTHLASAKNRQAMHTNAADLTDSMRMYMWGEEGGKPAPGQIGIAPEWFYKGCGSILRGHGEELMIPPYAGDGGEEPEIAGAYIIDPDGNPRRLGFMTANEFSDHRTEKKNYLYLAPSKLRTCAVGPELVVTDSFRAVPGVVSIRRDSAVIWSKEITTGEANMCHSLVNIEHHHFKFEQHRRPGDAHVHFYGADAFSFGAGVELEDGDIMEVAFEGMGRPLQNTLRKAADRATLIPVRAL
jgi:hypothetical protein